ncbi:hypothetical protein AK812_SmicGene5193 [Symbiodinium microadriaticum]|uniref:Uncharacterized protein n=1 Tax=Symbiodinium microadriaticum TaxID=2951 RepID=A0A1Q9EU84_SYMMI|nr:hypothetical protein AK812_SmicGene5193 [Symbiodinium microadriaticum]
MELACRNATEEPSEANLVKLLDLWSAGWKHRGRTRAVGPGAYERYATLGLFGHGGVVGVSNATGLRGACIAVNRFLKSALALGEYTGGRVWIEDDEGGSTAWLEGKKGGRELRGGWLDMHDKPVSFDARRYHKVEPHEGSMWALAAYVPQAYARATEQHRQALREVGFPLSGDAKQTANRDAKKRAKLYPQIGSHWHWFAASPATKRLQHDTIFLRSGCGEASFDTSSVTFLHKVRALTQERDY